MNENYVDNIAVLVWCIIFKFSSNQINGCACCFICSCSVEYSMASVGDAQFTDEEVNFFRLSCLLITEGTSIVRELFDAQVAKSGKKLSHLLRERENDMKDYRRNRSCSPRGTVNKKKGLLTDEQWKLMYETQSKYSQTSKEWDLRWSRREVIL